MRARAKSRTATVVVRQVPEARRRSRGALRHVSVKAMRVVAAAVAAALLDSAAAWGGTGGTDMPWNSPMQAILDNITGPTGKIIAGLLIALGGIVWGFTRHEEGFKRVAQAIIAIGLVLGATNLVTTLGFQGCVF
jgi:type IV secretion system protein TrbC